MSTLFPVLPVEGIDLFVPVESGVFYREVEYEVAVSVSVHVFDVATMWRARPTPSCSTTFGAPKR